MTRNLFSIPIFFIVFRETLEAAIIVSVLLGLAEQIVTREPDVVGQAAETQIQPQTVNGDNDAENTQPVDDALQRRRLLRRMRMQVRATC